MNKSELRTWVRQQKQAYQEDFSDWSADICHRVMSMSRWQSAHTVLLYHALPDEPNLQMLLDTALQENKQVLLPVVVNDDLLLKRYKGDKAMQEGVFHIFEPTGDAFPQDRYDEIDLAIIPGMAFDREGHRLGRGRGYYDRLLPRIPHAHTLGICFPFQLLDHVPSLPHDIPVREILTASL